MSGMLIDAYIKALGKLEESAFQRAIVQRLMVAINHFKRSRLRPKATAGSTVIRTRVLTDTAATGSSTTRQRPHINDRSN